MGKSLQLLIASLLALSVSSFAWAQQSPQQSGAQAQDATPTAAAKPASARQPAKAADKKPKKVWTNDDIPSAPDPDVPKPDFFAPDTPHPETKVGPIEKKDVVEKFRRQLTTLRAQLSATEKKISELHNFKGDNAAPSGGIDPHHGYSMTPISDQIRQLEEKKKLILANIDDVEEQARKQGIEPGQLR